MPNPLIWFPDQIIKRRGNDIAFSGFIASVRHLHHVRARVRVDGEIISLLKLGAAKRAFELLPSFRQFTTLYHIVDTIRRYVERETFYTRLHIHARFKFDGYSVKGIIQFIIAHYLAKTIFN